MPMVLQNKTIQRKELLQARRSLRLYNRALFSRIIQEKIEDLPAYQQAETCFLFVGMPDEVATKALILKALEAGKKVCLPYIVDKNSHDMQATLINSWDDLEVGAYNILTVKQDLLKFVDPKSIDFILVPAVGFDIDGYRLGMGGGFYDRYLEKATKAITCGCVYECQVVNNLVKDSHDAKVDYIITEEQIRRIT